MLIPVLCTLLTAAAPQFEANAGSGLVAGTLVDATATAVTLETNAGRVELQADDIVQLRRQGATGDRLPPGVVHVELVDGSQILAREFRVEKGHATIAIFGDSTLNIPTSWITSARFQEPSAKIDAQWAEIVATPRTADCLVLRKENSIDYLQGAIGDVTNDVVHFESEGEKYDVKRSRIEGLMYAASRMPKLDAAVCTVVDMTGTRLEASKLLFLGNALKVTTPVGVNETISLDRLQRLDYKVEYLSDLKPESVEHLPYLAIPKSTSPFEERFHRPRFNASGDWSALRLGGVSYTKGLSLYSRTQLVYRLPEKYSYLVAMAGLAESETPTGSVRLIISCDDRVVLDRVIQGSEVVPLSVDLKGARRLKILADFNGDEISDRLLICQPRLTR